MNDRQEENRDKSFVFIGFIVVLSMMIIICGMVSSCSDNKTVQNSTKRKVEREIAGYKTQKNGIRVFDMSKDYYFLNKQKGYKYPSKENMKYYSKILNKDRTAKVFLPANYDRNKEYPVLFLLHGLNGTKNTWGNKDADVIIQNLTHFEGVPEMIIICPDSNLNNMEDLDGLKFVGTLEYFDKTRDEIVDSILPELKRRYKGYVGAFAPVKVANYGRQTWLKPLLKTFKLDRGDEMKQVILSVGTEDDRVGKSVDELSQYMNREGVKHIFYHLPGGHEKKVWKNSLYSFVRFIFR